MKNKKIVPGIIITTLLAVLITTISLSFLLAVFKPPEETVFRPVTAPQTPDSPYTKTLTGEGINGEYTYTLSFVEFDDDGFFADRKQKDYIVSDLNQLIAKNDVIILLYVHGWNHNASFDDQNVACFEELVKATSMMQSFYKRDVYGIYVGWPGRVYESDMVNKVSYWGREMAANRISQRGDLLDLFSDISKIRNNPSSKKSKFIIIGHSLGGLATYKTLRPIMQRYIEGDIPKDLIADLTIFVNPAFSAEEHHTLHELMQVKIINPDKLVRFIIATSDRDEVLTGIYPHSQKIGSFLRGDYRLDKKARTNPAGLYEEYVTHELTLESSFENPSGLSTCPTLNAGELDIVKAKRRGLDERELYFFEEINHYNDNNEVIYRTVLKPLTDKKGPTMIIKVKDGIIPNHNDIFTAPFVDFIARVLNCEFHPQCREKYN